MKSGDVGKGSKPTTENEAMKKKRELHDRIIAKTRRTSSNQQREEFAPVQEDTRPPLDFEEAVIPAETVVRKRKRDGNTPFRLTTGF